MNLKAGDILTKNDVQDKQALLPNLFPNNRLVLKMLPEGKGVQVVELSDVNIADIIAELQKYVSILSFLNREGYSVGTTPDTEIVIYKDSTVYDTFDFISEFTDEENISRLNEKSVEVSAILLKDISKLNVEELVADTNKKIAVVQALLK